ncbi:peptidoglycan-associated lipoprotein Pal [Sphingomonas prati]|uniref:Peptidoglycan-associated lipoprotein n=1 Tax=Sphingomonas prati TaxID=1843237 RepID=A0A7W9F2F7_9SPHN|nr:peptidoglycan-associated lipoprotein Pal [Sphingomonas prati]MBB5728749.1 peptidoglycan-associated lipoprotein [Sphingomonas prati]GGE87857.1 peptidoglycan-associated lipoprotein [Sphingomonas prati]
MNHLTKLVLAGTMLVAVAGCAKKKPAVLPPPPAGSGMIDDGTNNAPTGGAIGGAAVPGSRADFIAQAGSDTVLFVTDSSDVDSEAQAILLRQAQWLQRNPNVRVTVEGHCDERGTREYNLALGDRRANSAKNFLASNGVDASRISVISYGKERPVATGSDESAYAQNRRAVTVVPVGAGSM